MYGPFPASRPSGLRRRGMPAGTELWRIDATVPSRWEWGGFPTPRHRFDPASGRFRVRYANTTMRGAARERYLDSGRFIPADHGLHRLVRLTTLRAFRVLDVRGEATLDALGVDDRISTSHDREVWEACHRLVDAATTWWTDLDGLVYRPRTAPASSVNVAFFSLDGLRATSRPLRRCAAELDELVLHHQFTIGFDY
jgi:hypothetical protein